MATCTSRHSGLVYHVMVDPAAREKAQLAVVQTQQRALQPYSDLLAGVADQPDGEPARQALEATLRALSDLGLYDEAQQEIGKLGPGLTGRLPARDSFTQQDLAFPAGSAGQRDAIRSLQAYLDRKRRLLAAQIPLDEMLVEDKPFEYDKALHDNLEFARYIQFVAPLERGAVEARAAGDNLRAATLLRDGAEFMRRAAKALPDNSPEAKTLWARAKRADEVAAQLRASDDAAGSGHGVKPWERLREQAFRLGGERAERLEDFVRRIFDRELNRFLRSL